MTRRKFRGVKKVSAPTGYHDAGFDALTEKLYRWLVQQPEWLAVLSADRQERKRYATLISDAVTRIPPYASDPPPEPKRLNIRVGASDE